jgi:hypothetical protein
VARGLAVEGFSDLDTLIAIRDFAPMPAPAAIEALEARIQARFAHIRGVEATCFARARTRAPMGSRAAIVLKTQSVCVHGTDLIPEIPPFRRGPGSQLEAPRLAPSLEFARSRLLGASSEREVIAYAVWALKILVRAAFELVQDRERGYTRDLFACAESFARHYPEKSAEIWRAAALAVEPTSDAAAVVAFLSDFGRWMCGLAASARNSWPRAVGMERQGP